MCVDEGDSGAVSLDFSVFPMINLPFINGRQT